MADMDLGRRKAARRPECSPRSEPLGESTVTDSKTKWNEADEVDLECSSGRSGE